MKLSKVLIKNGINAMIFEEEDHFKKNLIQSLSLKMNDSIDTVKSELYKNLLKTNSLTEKNNNLTYFLTFVECFKPKNFTFKDGSILNITESDLNDLVKLFEQLNNQSRQIFVKNIFESAKIFENHIKFAKKVKQLL